MQILHTSSFLEQSFASDAHIISVNRISRNQASDLLYAQFVVEAHWLSGFPCIVFQSSEPPRHFAPLFEDVKLIYADDWDLLDKSDAFLLNARMYKLCNLDKGIFLNLEFINLKSYRNCLKEKCL